jgi:hypothetical protein
MKSIISKSIICLIAITTFASCSTVSRSMKEPNARVELTKNDFELSKQVSATATATKILNIDWSRLRTKTSGKVESQANGGVAPLPLPIDIANLPIIGNVLFDKTSGYALYELMKANEGYDVIFYPQYEITVSKPILGIGLFKTVTTAKVTARLGKLK